MNRCLSDEEFARMTPAERRAYLDLLYAFIDRKLREMTPAQRQIVAAKQAGVKMAEYSPN